MESENLDKLHTGEDWILADIINKRTAIIAGISLNTEIGYGDMVIYDEDKKITQVVKKSTNTVYASHSIWIPVKKIKDYFIKENIIVEQKEEGIIALAVPIDMEDEDFQIVFYNCPIECVILLDENEGDTPEEEDE